MSLIIVPVEIKGSGFGSLTVLTGILNAPVEIKGFKPGQKITQMITGVNRVN
jgi:hypothetical protein